MANPRVHPSFPNGATEEPHALKWAPYVKGNPPVRKPEGDAYERTHEVIDGLVSAATHGHDLTVKSAVLHVDGAYTEGNHNVAGDGAYFVFNREAEDMVLASETCREILVNNHSCLQNRGAQAWAQTAAEKMSIEEMYADTWLTTLVGGENNRGFRTQTYVNKFVYACKTLWSNLKPYVARESKTTRSMLKKAFGDNETWGRFWEWAFVQDETLQSLATSASSWDGANKVEYLARMKTIIEDDVYGDAWEARTTTTTSTTGTAGVIQNPNPVSKVASAPAEAEVVAAPSGDTEARIASMRAAGMTGAEIANALGL